MVNAQGPWLGTASGNVIDLLDPDPSQFTIEDIATGLSNIARFNGQTNQWYSVAEHSIHVSELLPKHLKLQGLLHDATEAYLCDVPSPLKSLLGEAYKAIERRLAGAIGLTLGVDLINLHESTKRADLTMLFSERDMLQPDGPDWGWGNDTPRYPRLCRYYQTPETARAAFLNFYRSLTT